MSDNTPISYDEYLEQCIAQALATRRGTASIIDVCKIVWNQHSEDLRQMGDSFYTWQYDIRWAAHRLRLRGVLRSAKLSPNGIWELAFRP